jgi:hypothetical protein
LLSCWEKQDVPGKPKGEHGMDTTITERFKEAFAEEIEKVRHDLGALEALIKQKLDSLGRDVLEDLANSHANGYQGSSLVCKCGSVSRFVQYRGKDVQTLYGWIRIERAYYHCSSCGSSTIPYDQASGLGSEQLSAALAYFCCLLAVDDSFAQTSRKVKSLLGRDVSARTIERLVHQVGAVQLADQQRQFAEVRAAHQTRQQQAQPCRLYVTLDGTTVHEQDGWHEAKLGSIYWQDEHGRRQCRYVGIFENSEQFGWLLWYAACVCGLREAMEVIYIGDGAAWIRTEHHRHFSRASEHVWDCGKVLFGEGTEQTKRWVGQCLDLLRDGCTKKLLSSQSLWVNCKRLEL